MPSLILRPADRLVIPVAVRMVCPIDKYRPRHEHLSKGSSARSRPTRWGRGYAGIGNRSRWLDGRWDLPRPRDRSGDEPANVQAGQTGHHTRAALEKTLVRSWIALPGGCTPARDAPPACGRAFHPAACGRVHRRMFLALVPHPRNSAPLQPRLVGGQARQEHGTRS